MWGLFALKCGVQGMWGFWGFRDSEFLAWLLGCQRFSRLGFRRV